MKSILKWAKKEYESFNSKKMSKEKPKKESTKN